MNLCSLSPMSRWFMALEITSSQVQVGLNWCSFECGKFRDGEGLVQRVLDGWYQNVNLSGSDLGSFCIIRLADWFDIEFSLSGASQELDLSWANLNDANLNGSDLRWANTINTEGLDVICVQLNTSDKIDKYSTMYNLIKSQLDVSVVHLMN